MFKHPGKKDLYIALADRWNGPLTGPEFDNGELSRKMRKAFEDRFIRNAMTPENEVLMRKYGGLDVNTSMGRHVWLPIRFDGDRPYVEWRSNWRLGEFA